MNKQAYRQANRPTNQSSNLSRLVQREGHTGSQAETKGTRAIIKGTSHKDDILQAEINLVFGFIPERMEGVQQFYPADFLATMRKFGMFDVLQTPEGEPKLPPAFMLEAEKEALESGILGD